MKYWLFKTEPSAFSWQDLKNSPEKKTSWEGVRNYQARNYLREMKSGDMVLFYHSVAKPLSIQGTARVVKEAYPDHHQFEVSSKYYDPKATIENPRWFMVDIQWVEDFNPPIEREMLLEFPQLKNMVLLQRGSRLSIQPVSASEWETIQTIKRP